VTGGAGERGAPGAESNVTYTLLVWEGQMGRPRVYADAAAKQRAYRARLGAEMVLVNRRRWAALEARVNRLAEAVRAAGAAGCPVAREVRGAATDTIVESLTDWFETRAAAARDQAREGCSPEGAGGQGKRGRARRT
jgi:hypothetical protein